MADLNLPYKTTFAAQIRAIEPSDTDIKEAKASLTDLKAMLPAGINPEDNPQLLYIAANLYVAGMVNMNDDGVDIETSLAGYKGFEKQQLNIEHDRKRIAGYILHAGLSEFGTDRLITEDEARAAGKPFNVAIVAVLWKVANRELCDFLAAASNPIHPDFKALSLSFEVGFSSYNIGVINSKTRIISEARKIVTPAQVDYQGMSARLRSNGGSGRAEDCEEDGVYQILSGTFIPLGGGIVTMPAAAVKGIAAITEPITHQDVEEDEKDQDEIDNPENREMEMQESIRAENQRAALVQLKTNLTRILSLFEKTSISRIIYPETRVSPTTSSTINRFNMKSLKDIKEALASAKPEDMQQVVAGILEIAEALTRGSEELANQLEAEKNRGKEIENARAEAAAANDELKKQTDALKSEVDTLKAAQVAAAAEAKFTERMAAIDEVFELTDEDRAFFVEEIKSCETDEVFAAKLNKFKKLMKEKTKEEKAAKAAASKTKQDELVAALKAKGVDVKLDENDLVKEIVASAQANNVSAGIMNTIEVDKSLREQMLAEFAENVSIGGKKISEYTKKS